MNNSASFYAKRESTKPILSSGACRCSAVLENAAMPESLPVVTLDIRRIRSLEKELRRKDKALAETAALLVLKKKAQEIWGDEDENTTRKNGR